MAIYDTMQQIKPDVATTCFGLAGGMAAVLLAAGTQGKRYALPSSRIFLSEVAGGASAKDVDLEIQAQEINYWSRTVTETLARHTGHSPEQIGKDTAQKQVLSALGAVKYGLVDRISDRQPSFLHTHMISANYEGKARKVDSRSPAERMVYIGEEISDSLATHVVAQLLFLGLDDPTKNIYLYLNCTGGSMVQPTFRR